jgi:hypothetical protein
MTTTIRNIATRSVLPLAAAVVLVASSVLAAPPAFAGGIFADVYMYNNTQYTIRNITSHLAGGSAQTAPIGISSAEVVPGLVELEVAVPPLETCLW